MAVISFQLNDNLYIRDPQTSDLGRKIIESGIQLIDKLGFEQFTFRKLADEIQSTEASIYRYFENKYRMLQYLIDWYWTWQEYRLDYRISNVSDPTQQLEVIIDLLTEEIEPDPSVAFVNEKLLSGIVLHEFEKTFLTRHVDADNKEGIFNPYKSFCHRIAKVVSALNPQFKFPNSLVSSTILIISHQLYYTEHLPSLSNLGKGTQTLREDLREFIRIVLYKTIDPVC